MSIRTVKGVGLATAVALAAAACGGGGGGAGGDDEVFEFRVADSYSVEHSIGKASIQPFMEAVEERSEGRIKFEYFPDDSLVAAEDIPEAIASGTADLGNLLYIGNLNPLLYVVQLPGLWGDSQTVEASEAFFEFAKTNEPTKQKFEELQTVPLFCLSTTTYQLEFAGRGVDTFDEVEGREMRTAGVVLPHTIESIGAKPTDIAINEAYDAFNRGVIDSITLSVPSVKAYAFAELIESAIINANLGGFPVCYGISQSRFDTLPKDLQNIMIEEGEKIVSEAASQLISEVETDLQSWEEQGIELYEIEDEARAEAIQGVESSWIKQLEQEGVNGAAEAVEEWKTILDEHLG